MIPFRSRWRAAWLALLLVLLPAACRRSPGAEGPRDTTGTPVALPEKRARIVSLLPSVTEALFRLGAGDRVVGVTDHCSRPPQARNLPRVASYIRLDLEKILALNPDLVVAGREILTPSLLRLREVGAPLFVLPSMDSYEAILEGYRLLGRIIGESARAEEGIGEVEKRLARIRDRLEGRVEPRTFVEMGVRPLVTAASGCAVDDVLRFAGARNVAAGLGSKYPRVDMETILALDPEVVLLTTMTGVSPEKKTRWMEFEGCTAVRRGRIFIVNADDLCRPDPFAFVASVETVARLLHPDAFRE